jgi:hypothetical protein
LLNWGSADFAKLQLRDIVRGSAAHLQRVWATTQAAVGFDPIPDGVHRCSITDGRLIASKSNETPGFRLEFRVIDGLYAGRRVWLDLWLTDKAIGIAKGQLAKLGIVSLEQLEEPLPPGLIADVRVGQETNGDGMTFNRVKSFKLVNADVPTGDNSPPEDLDVERGEVADGIPLAGKIDAHGFNYETGRYESPSPSLDAHSSGRRGG